MASRHDDRPDVSVLVVTHNNGDLIGDVLEAIGKAAQTYRAEVFVVDNASTDDTLEVISRSRGVNLISLQENHGFARAVNLALESCSGRYVALVNSDAFPDPGCIDTLVSALQQRSQIGIVGAKLRYPEGQLQPSAGTFPSLLGGLWVALFLHRAPGLGRLGIGYFADERLYRKARSVDWVSAAVCAARRDAGPLPTRSFMYGEDVEWSLMCRASGLEVWLEPRATAVHVGRASVDKNLDPGFAQRQRVRFELEWFGRRGEAAQLGARFVLVVHAMMRLLLFGGRSLLTRRHDRRLAEYGSLLCSALCTHSTAT